MAATSRNSSSRKHRRRPVPLHAAALRAQEEALAALGSDAARFSAAIERYVNAVETADEARREWENHNPPRPLWTRGSMDQLVEHPLVRTMERLDRAAAQFGAALGLDPASAKRVGRGAGRPEGANSAADRTLPSPLRAVK